MIPLPNAVPSIHILGSREFGGADQFYVRMVEALHRSGRPVIAVNRPGSPVARALDEREIEQVHVPMANRWDFWSAWRLRRLVTRHAPCIVQTYMGRATRLTRVPNGVPAVHVARLGGFYKIDGYYRHAHAWVGNTRAICDYLIKQGLPPARVFHIGNFVPAPLQYAPHELQALKAGLGLTDDGWVLFALGRLIEKKGFQDMLQALSRLPAEIAGRPWVMLIAGDGEDAGKLKAHCDALGLSERVRWLGWQNPPDAWFALADLVLVPSRHEPLGNVILEAWNHRRPVLSTRSDGAQELIRQDQNGLLTPCADAAALADGIRVALSLPAEQRQALGEHGYRELNEKYGQAVILGAYLDLYDRLLREHLGGA